MRLIALVLASAVVVAFLYVITSIHQVAVAFVIGGFAGVALAISAALCGSHEREEDFESQSRKHLCAHPAAREGLDGMLYCALCGDVIPCDMPPPGWFCTRGLGHGGPCAAQRIN